MGGSCVTYCLCGLAGISFDPLALGEGDVQRAPPGVLVDVVVVTQQRPDGISGLLGVVVWNTPASTKASSAKRRGALTGHEMFPPTICRWHVREEMVDDMEVDNVVKHVSKEWARVTVDGS